MRGLVEELDDATCYAYTGAFLDYLETQHGLPAGSQIWFGHDLRPSSPRITAACMAAASDGGYSVRNSGEIPTPALAFSALAENSPAIMITGSHIPFDRNGIKFYRPDGELMKDDEAPILRSSKSFLTSNFDGRSLKNSDTQTPVDTTAADNWINRYQNAFGKVLDGMRIGHYQHSAAGRDLHYQLLESLGATVIPLCRSQEFVPIDTEAVSKADSDQACSWSNVHELDAIFSTDGDGDRPLLADETGEYLRGDTLGILAAISLGAQHVVTPVSSNTALEKCEKFETTIRTKIGSPHVIAAMQAASQQGKSNIVGFEANGGFLTATPIQLPQSKKTITALPTRDSILPILAVINLAKINGNPLSALKDMLPSRYTTSGRLQEIPRETSNAFIQSVKESSKLAMGLTGKQLSVSSMDETDGLRLTFENGEIIHLRPSGNAPELRIYVESGSPVEADTLLEAVTASLSDALSKSP